MPYTIDDHRRNHRQIDILLGQRPSRKPSRGAQPRIQDIERHIEKLTTVQSALTADKQTFEIFCLSHSYFYGASRTRARRREAVYHLRRFRQAKTFALVRIIEDLTFLRSQI